ncbi:MAG: hypothetical protein M0R46_14645 [Candidatus Muirbacterium halophilum]|nr:hypothetical protein [Candidatus Muirbacterium halophilum]
MGKFSCTFLGIFTLTFVPVDENEIRFNFYLKNYVSVWSEIDLVFFEEYVRLAQTELL